MDDTKKFFTQFTTTGEIDGDDIFLVHDGNGVKKITLSNLEKSFFKEFSTQAGFHNSLYRGKNLGTEFTADQQAAIAAGTFDDMYIGDYWEINGYIWRIAAFDYWLHMGDTECTTHHIVIVPDENLLAADGSTTHYMNTSNITTGAYVGSGFYSGTNADSSSNTAKTDCKNMAKAAFGAAHLLSHREYLKNAVTDGYESAGAWYDSDVEMMTEEMVYGGKELKNVTAGTHVPSNYTIDHSQLPLFALDRSKICNRAHWWLRDVVSSTDFALVTGSGHCNNNSASTANIGVRPAFAIF